MSSQSTLDSLVTSSSTRDKYQSSHPTQKAITDAILKMVVKDVQPVQIVEHEGFKALISLLEPRYNMVSRKHLQTVLLPASFKKVQEAIKKLLSTTSTCNITLDIWSSRRMHGYMGITCHFVTDSWEIKSLLLACSKLQGRHTGENIVAEYEEVISFYGLEDKVFRIITDNAANMKRGFQDLEDRHESQLESDSDSEGLVEEIDDIDDGEMDDQWDDAVVMMAKRISCFAHTLQLCVNDGIKGCTRLKSPLAKAGKIVAHVRKSTLATEELEKRFDKVLIAKNDTRWNSQVMMVRRLMELDGSDDLNAIVQKKELKFTASDKIALRELVDVLEQFQEASKLVQGEKYASISLALPCYVGLQNHLDNVNVRVLSSLVQTLRNSLETRLSSITSEPLYIIATALDPEFKLCWCSSAAELSNAKGIVLQELETVMVNTNTSTVEDVEEPVCADGPPTPPSKRAKLFSFMTTDHISKESKSAQQELDDYLQLVHTKDDIKKGSLQFWEKNSSMFPGLSVLAKKYLSVPATSVPIERVLV